MSDTEARVFVLCIICDEKEEHHIDGKCPFAPTQFQGVRHDGEFRVSITVPQPITMYTATFTVPDDEEK